MKQIIRRLIKKLFILYDIGDLTVGGHCGCCGKWIPNKIFLKEYAWGLCRKCATGQ